LVIHRFPNIELNFEVAHLFDERSMGGGLLAHIDSALRALRAARSALESSAPDASTAALADAFASVGTLYADLDGEESREVSLHLGAVYDSCLQRIGEARPGHAEGLQLAIELLTQVRRAEEEAKDIATHPPGAPKRPT
jgi:flagellin-specific chaperone FliS